MGTSHALSLAVLAFAVEDMNARACVITSARPWAIHFRREFVSGVLESSRCTSDLDTTRPISPGPIPGRTDFVLVYHLVVVRPWIKLDVDATDTI